MKARWRDKERHLTSAFVLALLFHDDAVTTAEPLNPNTPAAAEDMREDALQLIIDEGRRQIDAQAERYAHVTDRAQALLTASLVAVAFAASIFGRLDDVDGARRVIATALWGGGFLLLVVGVATAAATAVVKAVFSRPDTTRMTHWDQPALRELAADYGKSVIVGEDTIALRVTIFRQATRYVSWGAILVAIALAIVQ